MAQDEQSPASGSPKACGTSPKSDVHEVSPNEFAKWREMVDVGISQYMRAHPDRFHRRVRRGIPEKFRWQVWKAAVRQEDGAELPGDYASLSSMENEWTPLIDIDISRTFPDQKSFDGEQQQRLKRVLNAYAGYNPSVGYCQGMNFVAGLLLLVSDSEEESFAVLVKLMDAQEFGLCGFYQERLPLLRRYLRACEQLVAETVPELREHFKKENVQPAVYLHPWFLTLFINCFPLSMVMIIWDVIMCEGLPVILRIAVSILQVLKDSLLSMHLEEITKFFKMMKTYDDEDGELNAFRIGQLLMKHTEHVQIPESTMEYLSRSREASEECHGDSDDSDDLKVNLNSGTWFPFISRMFSFGYSKRGRETSSWSSSRSSSAPDLQAPSSFGSSGQGMQSRVTSAPSIAADDSQGASAGYGQAASSSRGEEGLWLTPTSLKEGWEFVQPLP